LGVIALGAAGIGDATAWCLLALAVAVVQSQLAAAAQTCLLAFLFLAAMLLLARPVAESWAARNESRPLSSVTLAGVIVAVLAAAMITEAIGIHAIFGAFLLGAILPHDSRVAREITERLHDVVAVVLLPAFFALTGMRTQIGLVSGWQDWLLCGLIVLTATAGKLGGAAGASRLCGLGWRDSLTLGALMNTRGLMELIVLNVGLDLGVISPKLFAMMVLMALATTLATTPVVLKLRSGASTDQKVAGNPAG
jgi:Kef-type K+ transport system membrane component KefB